jgi:hypothetical protein
MADSKYEINVNSAILTSVRKRMAAIEKRKEEDIQNQDRKKRGRVVFVTFFLSE